MKDHENYHDLLKVPDSVVNKQLRIELGKANAHIHELEHDLKIKNDRLKHMSEHLKGLEGKNTKLKLQNQKLNYQITGLKLRINNLHNNH